jgi:pimeloyl-ACP methyl ester carboxylesterase
MKTFEARGVELAWDSVGAPEGPALALVHETGTTSEAWRGIARRLGELPGKAVLYDRRGWGRSSAPEDYRRTTIEEQSEDLAELLAMHGPATLCGAGIGAVIVLDLILRRPDLVAGGALVEPHLPGVVPEATAALSEDRAALENATREGGLDAVVDLYLTGGLAALGSGAERLPAELTEAARERPASLVAELGATTGWAMPLHRLGGAEQPVAIVTAAGTPALMQAAAKFLAERLPGAELHQLPGEGPPHLGAPDELSRLVGGVAASTR